MGASHRHTINKQIIEVHIPATADVHQVQKRVAALYHEKLLPLIDQQLSERYGGVEGHYQIEKLTIDLGEVSIKEVDAVFQEKLQQAIATSPFQELPKDGTKKRKDEDHRAPTKVLSHYLMTGMLPWWCEETSKSYLYKQLDVLLKAPDLTFRQLLQQLASHPASLDRFLTTFTKKQLLDALQLLTTFPVHNLVRSEQALVDKMTSTRASQSRSRISKAFWTGIFHEVAHATNLEELEQHARWKTLVLLQVDSATFEESTFDRKDPSTRTYYALYALVERLKKHDAENVTLQRVLKQVSKVMMLSSFRTMNAEVQTELRHHLETLETTLLKIDQNLKIQKPSLNLGGANLKQLFLYLSHLVVHPSFRLLESEIHRNWKQWLEDLNAALRKSEYTPERQKQQLKTSLFSQLKTWRDALKQGSVLDRELEVRIREVMKMAERPKDIEDQKVWADTVEELKKLRYNKTVSEELRLLSTTILTRLQEINTYADKKEALTRAGLQPLTEHVHHLEQTLKRDPAQRPTIFKKLHSTFEETDFISIQNAGLVILWPFLPRFFENLKLTSEGKFHDHEARMKAVCALQYLCYEEEELFFEGILPLNKVLCGLALEEVVEQASLSAEEKEQAEGLLHSVISRGPLWTNLSLEGFRTSYLRREGLLRTRDDRWILQIKKETHDVTLQKLPWGFNVVKLPWMSDPLMVEWG